MWLLPIFSTIARVALRIFYRFEVAGRPVPPQGPVLLVANHPNALLDPAAVVAAAGRPVRFLAKSPLFTDPLVGWLVRASGAIPVYRRSDDPSLVGRNEDSFRAVYAELQRGAAVGIFPEGTSHSEPSLVPLKTGAARIALGAGNGRSFPVIPVGLSLRHKERFRSDSVVLVGDPVAWEDLAARGPGDAGAVHELTRRIDRALRDVTVNLQRWEDIALLEYAQEIFLAEQGVEVTPEGRLRGLQEVAAGLARARQVGGKEWSEITRAVRHHARMLRLLGLRPHELPQPNASSALRWALRSLPLFLLTAPIEAVGTAVFLPPYQATGTLVRLAGPTPDARATYKLLIGAVANIVWILLLVGALGWWRGPGVAIATLAALPLLGVATIWIREWRRAAGGALRRFVLRRRRAEVVEELRRRQRELGAQLAQLREWLRA